MTQDELWIVKWQEVLDFMSTNQRWPSKFTEYAFLVETQQEAIERRRDDD